MWIDKDGRCFPEMQDFSGMLRKNNVRQWHIIYRNINGYNVDEIQLLQFGGQEHLLVRNVQASLDKREFAPEAVGASRAVRRGASGRHRACQGASATGLVKRTNDFVEVSQRMKVRMGENFVCWVSVSSLLKSHGGERSPRLPRWRNGLAG